MMKLFLNKEILKIYWKNWLYSEDIRIKIQIIINEEKEKKVLRKEMICKKFFQTRFDFILY